MIQFSWLALLFPSGGEGKTGRVVDIRGWDVETGRSVASVTWADGTTNVYRVGHKGKVDLKCTVEASGGFYYKEHLPKLGGWRQIFAEWSLCWGVVIHAAVGAEAVFCLEGTKPPPDFLKFPHNEHHLREFGLCVNVLLDIRVVDEIVWTIRYPQFCPKEYSLCWKCRKFPLCLREPNFPRFGYICQSKAFHSSGKLLFSVHLENKHTPGAAKRGNVTKGRLWRMGQPKISGGKRWCLYWQLAAVPLSSKVQGNSLCFWTWSFFLPRCNLAVGLFFF